MKIKSFIALRPPTDVAERVAAPPYDVVDAREAREFAAGNPDCFLHVTRSEIDLPEDMDPYSEEVYRKASENFEAFKQKGNLIKAPGKAVYLYRLETEGHVQTGLITVCHVDDYDNDIIRKHEKTRQKTEDDRTRHVLTLNANTGPVFLTYRGNTDIERLGREAMKNEPLYDFKAKEGVRHTIWEIEDADPWINAFAGVPAAYVADGHHRAASAARVARLRRDSNPDHTGEENYNWFLSVLFPAQQLRVLPYNRCVKDLGNLSIKDFIERAGERFVIKEGADPEPDAPGHISMYIDGKWYGLEWDDSGSSDPVSSLDVSILQDNLLDPVLGIRDPRNDARIEFVGGVRGVEELTARVDSGKAAAAFSMHPVTVDQLMAVSDAGLIMPPKSTWFEPKLRSGLLVHPLDG